MSIETRQYISVALCTYNGARFLSRQLNSILQQTRLPDEVVICDDNSTDQTVTILREFAAHAPFVVRIVVNELNLGVTKNFEKAIKLCTGDLIALSDQDDIWYGNRIAMLEQELRAHPKSGLVFSNGDIIDDVDRLTGAQLWPSVHFTRQLQKRLLQGDYLPCLQSRFVTGATVMLRSSLRQHLFPIGEGWIHDEWMAAATPLFADLHGIDAALIRYRRHSSQQVGFSPLMTPQSMLAGALAMLLSEAEAKRLHWDYNLKKAAVAGTLYNRFQQESLNRDGAARLASYRDFVYFLRSRLHLPRARWARVLPVMRQLRAYLRYGGLRSVLKDLVLRQS